MVVGLQRSSPVLPHNLVGPIRYGGSWGQERPDPLSAGMEMATGSCLLLPPCPKPLLTLLHPLRPPVVEFLLSRGP